MKKLLFFVLTAALMFGCKKDDNAPTLPATDTTLPKKLVKVISTYEDPEHSEQETTTREFSYDESGKLVRIKFVDDHGNGDVSTIEYAQDQITIIETDLKSGKPYQTSTFRLNNGRVESYVYEDNSDGSDYKCETELSYGETGYLAGYVGKSTDRDTFTGTLTTDETGFLKKVSVLFEREDNDGTLTLDFVPNTSARNNLNLDLMYIGEILDETDELATIYGYLLGVCGKRTTCLPQQYTSTWSDEEETDSMIIKYDYVFDGEYISKIVIDYGDGEKSTLELFYEE